GDQVQTRCGHRQRHLEAARPNATQAQSPPDLTTGTPVAPCVQRATCPWTTIPRKAAVQGSRRRSNMMLKSHLLAHAAVAPQVARGWRRLPPADLENLITQIRRSAVRRHLTTSEWRQLDRMRHHLKTLSTAETAGPPR